MPELGPSSLWLEWLMSPMSGALQHHLEPALYWHARAMVLAWSFCIPLGVMVARFCKITPRQDWPRVLDNAGWWHAHRGLQYAGVLTMAAGIALVLAHQGAGATLREGAAYWHAVLGWCVLVAAAVQVLSAWLRGSKGGPGQSTMAGDHYDMTPRRVVFERVHKSLGWLLVLSALGVSTLGLVVADAPRWMALCLGAWWCLLLGAGVWLQQRGLCVDTYQAIWGADPQMPGMQRAPIGWGVRRIQQHPWR